MYKYPSFFDLLLIAGVFFLASVLAGALAGVIISLTGGSIQQTIPFVYPIPMLAAIFFALWLGRLRGAEGPDMKILPHGKWIAVTAAGFVVMAALSIVLEPLMELFPRKMFDDIEAMIGRGAWAMTMTVLLAPILEEVLFRGVIQDAAARRYGPLAGILIAAAVFGVIHVSIQVIPALFIGVVLGYVYYRTASLLPVILLHAANNLAAFLGMDAKAPDGSKAHTLHDIVTSPATYWSLYAAAALIVALGAACMWNDMKKKGREA